REVARDELGVTRAASLLAVVVRTGAAGEEAEPVAHPLELRAERVGDAGLEPADRTGAPPGEDDAGLPRLAQDPVEAVRAPDGEQVRGAAARDEDQVTRESAVAEVGGRPRGEVEVRHLGAAAQPLVPPDGEARVLHARRRD